jgi:hypothetical protein
MPTSDFRGQQLQPPHQQQQQPLHQPSSRHLRPSVIARQAKVVQHYEDEKQRAAALFS